METSRFSFCFVASRDWENPECAGGDLYLSNVARSLASRGNRVIYISERFPGAPFHERLDDVEIRRVERGLGYALRQLREVFRIRNKVDLIIEEMFGGKKLPALSLALTRKRLAIAWYQKHDKIFDEQYPQPIASMLRRMERILVRIYSKVPVITLSTKSSIELAEMGVNPSKIHIVPSAAVLETVPSRVPFQKREDHLVFIGKIRKYKRIDHALRCLKRIRESSLDLRKVKLVIAGNVGKGDKQYLRHLKDLTHELGIEDAVEFRIYPGLIPHKEKASLLGNAKILLQPSPVEGFSMTTVEANMCGTPVIVSDGVPRDVVSHGDNGFVYPFGDIDSMASYSDKLLTDAGLWNQLSANGVSSARKFTWENSASLLELLATEVRSSVGRFRREAP